MDPDTELDVEISPIIRIYKSGRIERLFGNTLLPAGVDPLTGVASRDVVIDATTNLSARLYLPPNMNNNNNNNKKLPILVYYHGGGFCVESPFSSTFHPYLNLLTSKATILAVSVNYRLAPEHPLPTAYNDSLAALRWVSASSGDHWLSEYGDLDRVFLAGDSAGGNIAYNVARMAAGDDASVKLEGLALVHPHFWGKEPVGEEVRDPGEARMMERLWRLACPGSDGGDDDPRVNPLVLDQGSPELRCRRVAVFVAERDGLTPRAVALYEKLRRGVAAELVETEGEGHDFHIWNPECDKAVEKMRKFAAFLNA